MIVGYKAYGMNGDYLGFFKDQLEAMFYCGPLHRCVAIFDDNPEFISGRLFSCA